MFHTIEEQLIEVLGIEMVCLRFIAKMDVLHFIKIKTELDIASIFTEGSYLER